MATRGPKPKPKVTIDPGPMPEPPDWLVDSRSVALWNQYGPVLNRLGLLESLDAIGFAMLCDAIAFYLDAAEKIDMDELVVYCGESGSPAPNPLVGIVRAQAKAVRELLIEYGMTPNGRIRLTGSTSVKPVDLEQLDPLEQLARRMAATPPVAIAEKPVTPARRKRAAKKASKKAAKRR
ncbi:MAG: P27 family phage terminase small subunit [Planctomyces sp.]|nr:P27 family phage terminase small subunit [Planctomyces sp.]